VTGPTRRDFDAMLLGSAIAMGCRGGKRTPGATLVDTGMGRGHARVRDLAKLPTPTRWRKERVVIIGAGVAGLAAAWQLRKLGVKNVLVIEHDDVIGGTARSGSSEVTSYPWGAHYIVAPLAEQTALTQLLSEMGAIEGTSRDGTPIVDEALRCREPEERVFFLGRWYEGLYLEAGSSDDDRRQLAAFRAEIDRWSAYRDAKGRRAFTLPRSESSDDPAIVALDNMSFASWLDSHGLTSSRLRCGMCCSADSCSRASARILIRLRF